MKSKLTAVTDTLKELFVIFSVAIGSATILYCIFEHKNLWDGLWWAIVTSMTVGYGDTYPHTVGGRFVAIVLMMFTVLFIIPLITAHLSSKLIVDNNAFTNEEQEEIKESLRHLKKIVGI